MVPTPTPNQHEKRSQHNLFSWSFQRLLHSLDKKSETMKTAKAKPCNIMLTQFVRELLCYLDFTSINRSSLDRRSQFTRMKCILLLNNP